MTHDILVATGIVTLLIWSYLLLARGAFWRVRDDAPPLQAPPPCRVNVVIPARDEAATIAQTVTSLRRQQYPAGLGIYVVDDDSADGTAAIAQAAGAAVISAGPLPSGWTGKMWALSQGVRAALTDDPDYLLLTDADIEHAPDSIAALVSRAEAWNLDLASYMVRLHCETAAERRLIPAFVFFFLKLYPPAWIAIPRARTAGAAGGCILIRPRALERIGGIAALRGELIDDCALARAVKREGRIWMGLTSTTRSIRIYRDFAEVRAMIARTAFTQLNHSALLLAGTVAGMALTYLAAPLLVFSGDPMAAGLGAVAWLLLWISYAPVLRLYRRPLIGGILLPVVALFFLAATWESAVDYWRGKGGMWKGRSQDPQA